MAPLGNGLGNVVHILAVLERHECLVLVEGEEVSEKMRAEFERWAVADNKWLIDQDSFGNYIYGFVRDAWGSWQMSRASIEVKLPRFDDYPASIELEMQKSLREVLEPIGLKVTP